MQKYIFILGKNWLLSLSEIKHFLRRENYKGTITDYSACAAIVEFEQGDLSENSIAQLIFQLGGTLKICKVVDFIDDPTFMKAFPEKIDGNAHPGVMIDARKHVDGILKDSIYPIFGKIKANEEKKYFVANSIYPISYKSSYYKTLIDHFLPFVNKNWVKNLKERGAKSASYFRYPEENMESGNLNPIFPHHYMRYELYKPERKEIVYILTEEGLYLSYTLNVTNSNEIKMMDEDRPYKFMRGAIPPKFAKIMINLLDIKRPFGNRRILDPFCGTGTILMFAYVQGIQVFGTDTDQKSVSGTRKNLRWIQNYLEKPLKMNLNSNIVNSKIDEIDSKFGKTLFDGVVTEPILLPYFKEIPNYNDIEEIVNNNVIPTYTKAFEMFHKVLKSNSRVVITAPSIQTTDGGRIRVYLNDIAENNDFHKIRVLSKRGIVEKSDKTLRLESKKNVVYDGSSKYFRREFYIFEKNT